MFSNRRGDTTGPHQADRQAGVPARAGRAAKVAAVIVAGAALATPALAPAPAKAKPIEFNGTSITCIRIDDFILDCYTAPIPPPKKPTTGKGAKPGTKKMICKLITQEGSPDIGECAPEDSGDGGL
jgi:hypothetical protein